MPSLTKYTSAGQVLGEVLKKLIPQVVASKNALDLCIEYISALAVSRSRLSLWTEETSSSQKLSHLCGTRAKTASRSAKVSDSRSFPADPYQA